MCFSQLPTLSVLGPKHWMELHFYENLFQERPTDFQRKQIFLAGPTQEAGKGGILFR
jgi:hypothetical protein